MRISKTAFKEFTRCSKVYPLHLLYTKKMKANVLRYDDERYDKMKDILGSLFDVDTEEEMEEENPQLEAMMQYYDLVEKYALDQAAISLGTTCTYYSDSKQQKKFSFQDEDNNEWYCYLDGFEERNNEYIVLEVKATTAKKFYEFGPKGFPLFKKEGAVLRLKSVEESELTVEKYSEHIEKLFDRYNDVGKYVFDLAVQYYIIQKSIQTSKSSLQTKRGEYYLAVLNSEFVYDGVSPYVVKGQTPFVIFVNLTAIMKTYISKIERLVKQFQDIIMNSDPANPILGKYCEYKKQTACDFCPHCWKDARIPGSILEYMGIKKFKSEDGEIHTPFDYFRSKQYHMLDVPPNYLRNTNHQIQRECMRTNSEHLDRDKIQAILNTIQYPIYHLDFESFPCPIPRFKGEKPYAQSVFQFSIHVERKQLMCDFDRNHVEFLAEDFNDHREELIQKMIDTIDLSQGGTVLVYNRSFEKTRIKEWMEIFPKYKSALEKINNHMFDLLDAVKGNQQLAKDIGCSPEEAKRINYYHNKLHGSYSIKKVLPVFTSLDYSTLAVQNGTEAIVTYATFPALEKEELEEAKEGLVAYCKQDTWAMVLVLWGLIEKVSRK